MKLDTKTPLSIGKGYVLGDKEKKFVDIVQKQDNRKGHTFVFGTTRVGKTRLAENCITQDILAGRNIFVIDPKVDNELFSKIYSVAKECGREHDIIYVSTIFPQYSAKLNILSYYFLEDEIISHVMSGVPAEDEFFYNYAYEIVSIIVRGIIAFKKLKNISTDLTLNEISGYVSFQKIKKLRDDLNDYKDHHEDIERIIILADSVLEGEKEYFGKVSSTLRGTLTQLTTGNLATVTGRADKNAFLERVKKNEGAILYIQTGAMLQGQSALTLGKLMISMVQAMVGRLFAEGKKFEVPLCMYIDELSNCCYRGIEDMFNKSGGANCFITGLTQSPADIIAVIGADRARKLFDNTNTKIFMRMNDMTSARELKLYGGVEKRTSTQLTLNGGIRTGSTEEDVLKETDFTELRPREYYYMGFEGKFKGKTAPVESSKIMIVLPEVTR